MKDCYKKFWKKVFVEKMHAAFPQFVLKESTSRSAADEIKPSSKPINFVWNPIDKLTFTAEFVARGKQDAFEALFYWSEKGKVGANGTEALDYPFTAQTYELINAAVMLQTLSFIVGDSPEERVFNWEFWKPITSMGNLPAWKAEFIAEELRVVSDEEARRRVEIAVDKAIIDIKRCALPWFGKKLELYQKNKKPA